MKKIKMLSVLCVFIANLAIAQEARDLFNDSNIEVTWLGVDYSHVKLLGGFSQFYGSDSEKKPEEIRDKYFPGWNKLILAEPAKFDIKGMLRLERLHYDTTMIREVNAKTNLSEIEAGRATVYTLKYLETFVSGYKLLPDRGVSVLFIAESFNKVGEEAYYHFVVLKNENNQILLNERFQGRPSGFGIRNYWAGSLYGVIKQIKGDRYKVWKSIYSRKNKQ